MIFFKISILFSTELELRVVYQVVKQEELDELISDNGVLKLVSNSGSIEAKSIKIDAGKNGLVDNSGILDVSSTTDKAGSVEITGKEILINSGSKILAKGKNGGGDVLIGGDWKGSGDLLQATFTTVEKNTLIDAS